MITIGLFDRQENNFHIREDEKILENLRAQNGPPDKSTL